MAAGSLTVVLVGAAAATVIGSGTGSGSGSGSGSGHTTLHAHTLVHLRTASAVAEVGGQGFAADDVGDDVVRFDPRRGRIEGSVHVSGRPTAMVAVGRHLWVADMVDNQLVEVDAAHLRVMRSVPVPAGPSGLAVLGGTVWVASLTAGQLTPVDVRRGTAGPPITVAAGAVRVAAGFGALWVTGTNGQLTRVVPASGGVGAPAERAVRVGQGPIGVAAGAGAVWVADAQGNAVTRVDPATLGVTVLHGLGDDPLCVAVAGPRVYVGFGTAQRVRVVSPSPASAPLALGAAPRGLLAVGGGVWVASSNPGRVSAVAPTG